MVEFLISRKVFFDGLAILRFLDLVIGYYRSVVGLIGRHLYRLFLLHESVVEVVSLFFMLEWRSSW